MAVKFGSKTQGALSFPYNTGPSVLRDLPCPLCPEIPNTSTRLPLPAAYFVLRGTSTAVPPSLRAPVVVCLLCRSSQSVSSNSQ